MRASLVIMAAGMASRYGGNKQVDGVGPNNEILMEYSAHDAIRAGFGRIVFIIKPEMTELMERLCGEYLRTKTAKDGQLVDVAYAYQTFDSIPDYYTIPEGRTKPFGTIHALLSAKDVVDGPFCVINADDYYGVDGFGAMYQALVNMAPQGKAAMVGYSLLQTASHYGTVSRGKCTVADGKLVTVEEVLKIQLDDDDTLVDLDTDTVLAPDTIVSMNLWGFQPSIFTAMDGYFEHFLRYEAGDNVKAECLLPVMVGEEVTKGALEVEVLHSPERWFGMTYAQDRPVVMESLKALHDKGVYPETLR
ncbi:sugar phosphate nucleotidyltransferase [Bengtsoniella intestinalis]|uniref:sugar phosphate nucleotidyltransferase n=1 Tax=Bengtsoniella intestinalis TaxID=3073143 RepID=UPI00391EE5E4